MVEVLVIPDGAAEPLGADRTSLERARTPALDALCAAGAVHRVATTPAGLAAGSEIGIPTLLGAPPVAPVDRASVEAAAAGIEVPPGIAAWRCDLPREAGRRDRARALAALRHAASGHAVHHLRGHRLLLVGDAPPPAVAGRLPLFTWARGAALPRVLGRDTVVISGPGAAAGCARLLGARCVVPAGATGEPGTDLRAKARAALDAAAAGARRVVVHVGGPDEAAHDRDRAAKIATLEAIDAALIAPLAAFARAHAARLAVCSDHGADPRTGAHDPAPVPGVLSGLGVPPSGPGRLVERLVAGAPVAAAPFAPAAALRAAA